MSERPRIGISACFMHLDTFEAFFDDLVLAAAADVNIDPDTLNIKDKGKWVTARGGHLTDLTAAG